MIIIIIFQKVILYYNRSEATPAIKLLYKYIIIKITDFLFSYNTKKRGILMKKNSEKKTLQKSLKMTEEEGIKIQTNANDLGKSFNAYVVKAAVEYYDCIHGKSHILNPEIMVKITNIVNMAAEIAQQQNRRGISKLRKDVNELWSELL